MLVLLLGTSLGHCLGPSYLTPSFGGPEVDLDIWRGICRYFSLLHLGSRYTGIWARCTSILCDVILALKTDVCGNLSVVGLWASPTVLWTLPTEVVFWTQCMEVGWAPPTMDFSKVWGPRGSYFSWFMCCLSSIFVSLSCEEETSYVGITFIDYLW